MRLAEKISEDSTKTSAAIEILKLNVELYPSFGFSYVRLADLYERKGDIKAAIENYEQGLKLDPENRMAQRRLEGLKKK